MSKLGTDNDGTLVHEQARHEILRLIEQNNYLAGDRIPSERDLEKSFGIHRMTVRKAINFLVADGVLERRGTSGTYVPAPVVMRPITINSDSHSISEIVKQSGGKPGSKLLFFEHGQASQRAAKSLQIDIGDPLIVIKRLRTVDGLPFCVETTWLPSERLPGLAADDLLGDHSLYELLDERYGIKAGQATATISSATITSKDLEILDMKSGEQALIIHSVVSDADGIPIEYLASFNHPRRVMLTAE